jgi:apolipoprotein N-acyltransferase
MNLAKKIEEIRQKPEHVRLRYVWFLVTLSMTFIFIIWIFSLKSQPTSAPVIQDNIISPNLTQELQAQKESWQATQQQLKNTLNEAQNQQATPPLNPAE